MSLVGPQRAGPLRPAWRHDPGLHRQLGRERAMRSIAIGPHNWTSAGTDPGGERAASLYSLVETAKLNGLLLFAQHGADRFVRSSPVSQPARRGCSVLHHPSSSIEPGTTCIVSRHIFLSPAASVTAVAEEPAFLRSPGRLRDPQP